MTSTRSRSELSAPARAAGIVVAVTVVLAILTLAFALPAVHTGPRDVPIGVAGTADAAARLTGMLDQNAPGAFAVTAYPDRAALTDAIGDRDVYGGFALPSGPGE
ncbi:hypothetical protein MVAC_28943, partial [Mycolicibacterium vaccae ATCC 25954]